MARDTKRVLYRYNGVIEDDEVVQDLMGDLPRHFEAQIIERNGKSWKVERVKDQSLIDASKQVLVHWVFLTDEI